MRRECSRQQLLRWTPPAHYRRAALAALACAFLALLLAWRGCAALPPAGAAPPFPAHARPSAAAAASAAASAAADLDIVYVSGFPAHFASSARTLCAQLRPARLGAVHVIVPDSMEAHFSATAARLARRGGCAALRFRVWRESALVPAFTPGARQYSGTVRQMALKLAAAFVVAAPFYLVMDSDVYARRPFGAEDLLTGGGGGGGGGSGGAPLRARTGLDDSDAQFAQPRSWFRESAALLGTALIDDTDAYCARGGSRSGGGATWFAASGTEQLPDAPFALLPGGRRGGGGSGSSAGGDATAAAAVDAAAAATAAATVYGACRAGRGLVTHVTPMVLSTAIVRDVLAPRLAERGAAAAAAGGGGGGAAAPTWLDALLAHQAQRESACWQGLLRRARFYSWTEYSLYFVAAVAARALDQYHDFAAGGITSLAHSVMTPERYDAADWRAAFTDERDTAPFLIAHSWFGKPLAELDARIAQVLPAAAAGADEREDEDLAAPTPLPLY